MQKVPEHLKPIAKKLDAEKNGILIDKMNRNQISLDNSNRKGSIISVLDQSEITENQIVGFSDDIKDGPKFNVKGKIDSEGTFGGTGNEQLEPQKKPLNQ